MRQLLTNILATTGSYLHKQQSRMQPGISTYSVPWAVGVPDFMPPEPLSAIALLELAQQHGIKHVQFGDNLPLHTLRSEELYRLKQFASVNDLSLEVGTKGLKRANIEAYLQIAGMLQSPFLRVVIDDADFYPSEAEVIKIIKELLPLFRQHQIKMAIENHDRFPALSLEKIIQRTDPEWVGICLDTANSIGANEGIATVLQVLAPCTLNLHIKDIIIKRVSHKMGFAVSGCAAGRGLLDIPVIISSIKTYGRCRSVTLELWSDPEESIEATLQKEKALFEESINYLKNILQ